MRITTDTHISLAKPKKEEIDEVADAMFPREVGYYNKHAREWVPGFTEAVIGWFEPNWFCYHTKESKGSQEGYPDLTCVHISGIVLWAELKTERGVVDIAQAAWLWRLARKHKNVYLWKPSDKPEIIDLTQRIEDWWHRKSS